MPSAPTPPGSGSVFKKILTIGFALVGIGLILWLDSWFMDHTGMPDLNGDLNFGLLFLIGFLTSFHCVGMCGPLILGYIAKSAKAGQHSHTAHLLYGAGKTVSYASIGALFGAFGAIVAFTPFTQGVIGVAAGFFLILFGIHMLEIFPALHHFQFKTPAFVMRFVGKEYRKHSNPFVIGLLNGLMIICGPLQAMYVMAAGSGSWLQGAAILLFFGLGTLPLLMGFGVLTSLLSANLTPKLLKASGVIVIALGVIMLNRGLSVTGSGADFNTLLARLSLEFAPTSAQTQSCENEQTIRMEVLENRFSPNKFTLRKGVPVKWVIDVKELNQCNKEIVVRDYGLEIQLRQGTQVVEFTPPEAGVVAWSCWMGMIPGTFIVVDDVKSAIADPASPAAVDAGETVWQRLLHLFREQWQKILR
ncbi:sulfite exporter TauE/SafE family protein [Methylomonas sp. HW2-6]|uniref:urease accessory protein UreH domain-containing protein n=1 Tax=Methylomonas sp. HW2-6 TaxID=3376687 RepID=UPI0040413F52